MKRLSVLLLTVVALITLSNPVFAQGKFVEATAPEGKALVYIYIAGYGLDSWSKNAGILVLAKDGPIEVLPPNSYCVYVTDPGITKLWAAPWANKYSIGFKLDTVAGQIYYAKLDPGFKGFNLIPNETAKKEIAACKLIE